MNYPEQAKQARLKVLDMIYSAQTSHIGSNFSCIDIMTVLFDRIDLDKDRFILSAGWKAASLYYFLWKKGRITEEELNSYCKPGSKFIGLAEPVHPDIPFAGGSMGMGFPAAVGFALAKKMKGEEGIVYCLMSDGEMQIGTTWESAMIAAHHKLDNLRVVVDNNKLQAMGEVQDILSLKDLRFKWKSFGWVSYELDGHNYNELLQSFNREYPRDYGKMEGEYMPANNSNEEFWKGRPRVYIANTIKGKGVSFMEHDNIWHYKAPNEKEYKEAKHALHHE